MKFIRCFAYGLTGDESIVVKINGQPVEFSTVAAQVDVSLAPAEIQADSNAQKSE